MTVKAEILPPTAEITARLKALGDPVRWSVVDVLSQGERCVCDLESIIGIAQSRLSYHLAILREAGVVSDRKSGRWVYYSLVPGALDVASGALEALARTWRMEGRHQEASAC